MVFGDELIVKTNEFVVKFGVVFYVATEDVDATKVRVETRVKMRNDCKILSDNNSSHTIQDTFIRLPGSDKIWTV